MSDSFFRGNATYLFRAGVDYLFRRRIPGLTLVRLGVGLLALLLAGLAIGITIPTADGTLTFSFSSEGTPLYISLAALTVALVLIGIGVVWTRRHLRAEDRKRVIAVELRGLRDTSGQPLAAAVPARIEGRRDPLLINLRQGQDGTISAPDAALREIQSLPFDLKRREAGFDREDISYVLAGLAPVPFSFLTGVLIDDEGSVTLMDWNRHEDRWAELDGQDDGNRFAVSGLQGVPDFCSEVVMAVSVSYGVDRAGIAAKFPAIPVVELTLQGAGPDVHWSEEKQIALAREFHETAIALGNKGVALIHLVLAAPNSVVLRFGRRYDKRNLPDLIVYQYERSQSPPYPWGIRMPVQGRHEPQLVS